MHDITQDSIVIHSVFKAEEYFLPLIPRHVLLCAVLVVGFERITYMVNETDEQVELCAIVSVPEDQNIGDVTFSLAVETQNGTAGMSNRILELIWVEFFAFQDNDVISAELILLTKKCNSLPM